MRTESECSAHSFWVIRDVSVLTEFTSRHTCVIDLRMCRSWDTPQPNTRQDTTRHDTGHRTQGTRDTVRRSERLFSMEELGPLCPLCSCELIILCTTKLSRNTHQTPKNTKQCPFWCIPYPISGSTTTIRSYLWRSDSVVDVILREEARYDVPKVPLASHELICVTVCFHVVVGEHRHNLVF